MNSLIFFFVFLFLLNLIIYFNFLKISQYFNLYDLPNSSRKIHKKKISLLGGVIFFLNIFCLLIYLIIFKIKNIFYYDNNFIISFFIPIFFVFLIGLYDDKYTLKAEFKLFFVGILMFVILHIDNSLVVQNLYFSSLDRSINLGVMSIPFTILCFLLFMNALNMFDGTNLQVGIYFFIVLIFIFFKDSFQILSLIILFPLVTFLFLNFYNRSFLGDNGSLLIAYLISYLIIKTYNNEHSIFSIEEIFILMMLPGVDMFRLFIERIYNKRNPFKPDNKHIHHFLLKKYNSKKTFLIIQLLILLPILISIIFNEVYGLALGLFFYGYFLKLYNTNN